MKISWQQLQRLTSFLLCCIPVKTDKELVFVQAVWRHGDRAPLGYPYPEDPYNETAWPRGWSQLTNLGMQQMYELGTFFRQRYNNLINQNYVEEDVGIFFSNSDRTANSAQAFAFGFYPAQGSFQWQEGNSWQPTPLRQGSDLLLKPQDMICYNYRKIAVADFLKQAKIYNGQYAKLFKLFENQTGIGNFSFKNIGKIYDIHRELIHNMTEKQPDWVFKTWPEYGNRSTMEIVKELYRIQVITGFNSPQKSKMKGGHLLYSFIHSAHSVAEGTMPTKMMLLSAHDSTIYSLMYAMNVANDLLVPYAATVIMEVYSENSEYFVEFFYRNETTQPPHPLSLPSCGTRCTVRKFAELYSNMAIIDYAHHDMICRGTTTIEIPPKPVPRPSFTTSTTTTTTTTSTSTEAPSSLSPTPQLPLPQPLIPPVPPLQQPCENTSSVICTCDSSTSTLYVLFNAILLIVMNLL